MFYFFFNPVESNELMASVLLYQSYVLTSLHSVHASIDYNAEVPSLVLLGSDLTNENKSLKNKLDCRGLQ